MIEFIIIVMNDIMRLDIIQGFHGYVVNLLQQEFIINNIIQNEINIPFVLYP